MWLNLFLGVCFALNLVPDTPVIREPTRDGQVVGASDVHMEAAPMSHPDPARVHVSSDWEIVTAEQHEVVWRADAAVGVSKNHIHLGDGEFLNSHHGRTDLLFNTQYVLRVRYRDDLGTLSDYAERTFVTGNAFEVYGLSIHDILDSPAPTWKNEHGDPIVIPPNAALRLDTAEGLRFLEWTSASIDNPGPLEEHHVLRLRFLANGDGWELPMSRLAFHTDDADVTVYLPSLSLTPRQVLTIWVAANGSSYWAESETRPVFGYFNVARSNPVPWRARNGYRVEPFATNLKLVVNIAMVPNPGPAADDILCYAAELHGEVKAITRDGTVSTFATGLLNYDPNEPMPGSGEKGLTGIAIDPDTGDVWVGGVYWMPSAPPPVVVEDRSLETTGETDAPARRNEDNASAGITGGEGTFYNRILRLRSNDGGRTAASIETILDMRESTGAAHQVGAIYFRDGSLYANIGDGLTPAKARDLDSFLGKIIRMRLDGSPHETNPYYDPADGITARDYIYAIGFRNPFGGAFRRIDGALFCVENGPATDRMAIIHSGGDYGWNGYDESMQINKLYTWFPSVAPVAMAICEPTQFNGGDFPQTMWHSAFVTEFGPAWAPGTHDRGKRISEFVVSPTGELLRGPTPLVEFMGDRLGRATISAIAFGPGGLYFSDFFKNMDYQSPFDRGSNIFRVVYVGGHQHGHDDGHEEEQPEELILLCPHDYSIPAEDENGALTGYPEPTIENAAGPVAILYDPPAGTRLPIGEHLIRVRVIDSAFREQECTFILTITTGKPAPVDPGTPENPDVNPDRPATAAPIDDPGPTDAETRNGCGNGVCPASAATLFLFLIAGLLHRTAGVRIRRR